MADELVVQEPLLITDINLVEAPNGVQYDENVFQSAVVRASAIATDYTQKMNLLKEMEDIWLMKWQEKGSVAAKMGKHSKMTIHPGPRNEISGYVRLLASTQPEFSIPKGLLQPNAVQSSEMIERAAKHIWQAAGNIRNDPVHLDLLRSAAIFGEVHIMLIDTKEHHRMMSEANRSPAEVARAKRVMDLVPYLYDVVSPRFGYPMWDQFGLREYFSEREMTKAEVVARFGEKARIYFGDGYNPTDPVTLRDWWDLRWHIVWVLEGKAKGGGSGMPLLFAEHKLPELPIVCTMVEGSRLFPAPRDQSNPFLYTYNQSGLWKRANLALSVMYTNLFILGANPQSIFKQGAPGQKVEIKPEVPGGMMVLPPNSDWRPVGDMGVIDPSLVDMFRLAVELEEESTLYKQAMGAPLGKNAAYSMVALLSAQGRLPLSLAKQKGEWAIAECIRLGLSLMKHNSRDFEFADGLDQPITLKADQIPANLQIECKLEVAAPRDMREDTATAVALADKNLASNEWIQENVLRIGQPMEMRYQIMAENAYDTHYAMYVKDLIQQAKMKEEMQKQMYARMSQQMAGMPVDPSTSGMPEEEGMPMQSRTRGGRSTSQIPRSIENTMRPEVQRAQPGAIEPMQ
jgi:hypothetical protein